MTEENQAQTKAYMVFMRHIEMIEAKAQSMGQASNSAALRSILDEWQAAQETKKNSMIDAAAYALTRQ